jgi:hypothetical protein
VEDTVKATMLYHHSMVLFHTAEGCKGKGYAGLLEDADRDNRGGNSERELNGVFRSCIQHQVWENRETDVGVEEDNGEDRCSI